MTQGEESKTAMPTAPPPEAKIKRSRGRLSFVWIAPIAALVLTGVLGYQAYQKKGIAITISFPEAHGIAPDDAIMYRGLRVGTVRDVFLSDDLGNVIVEAEIRRDAQAVARDGTLFWIVRPQITLREVTGLDTLLGSRYIAVEPNPSESDIRVEFSGLAAEPLVEIASSNTLTITLKAKTRGSMVEGAAVSYRGMPVGRIRGIAFAPDATGVLITAEIDEMFTPLIRENSRFWKPSAIEFDAGFFRGISLQFDSLSTLVGSGIAFATPSVRRMGAPVADGHLFDLEEEVNNDWLDWEPAISLSPKQDQ